MPDEPVVTNPSRSRRARITGLAVALAIVCAAGFSPAAQAQSPGDAAPSPRALLRSMADYLAAQRSFTFHTEVNFEIFDRGQKLQFSGAADIQVRRPDGLAIDYRDDLSAKRVWYDGSQLTLVDPSKGVHASMPAPPNMDDALDHFEEQYGLVMPLSDLIGEDIYQLIATRAQSASYVGLHNVDGEACHHLAFVGEFADLQLWIDSGERPVPCKFVVDYKEDPGRPEYVAVLSNWEFGKKLANAHFQPDIPDGSRKIEFLQIKEDRR